MSKSIDTSNWKRFKLDELFEISGSKTTPKSKLESIGEGIYPYVTTQATINGIAGYYNLKTENGNCLTIDSAVLGVCFYQEKGFSASDHVEILRPKFAMNKYVALFMAILVNRTGQILQYDYNKKRSQKALKHESILLPVDLDGKPNWEFMQETIKQTQSELFSMIKLYECLKNRANDTIIMGGGLPKPFILSHNTILQSFINEAIMQIANSLLESLPCQWGEFKIAELFNLELSKGDLQPKKLENGEIPLVSAGNFNNGIVMKIRGGDGKAQKFSKNVITIDMFGKAFYQNNDFYAVSHGRVNICVPKFELNFYTGLFLVSVLDKSLGVKFGFDKMCSQSKLEQESIFLPITSQQKPDFTLMQNFIKGIEQSHTEKLIKYYEFLQNNNGGGD